MEEKKKASKFIPAGWLFIVASFFSGQVEKLAHSLGKGLLAAGLFLATDLLRACFLIGIGCLIIGWVRKSKKPKE